MHLRRAQTAFAARVTRVRAKHLRATVCGSVSQSASAYLPQSTELDVAFIGSESCQRAARLVGRELKAPAAGIIEDEYRNVTVAQDGQLTRLLE